MFHRLLRIVCAAAPLIGAIAASAETPNQINYQGRLTGPTGTAVPNGSYPIKFVIYDAATAGNEIWNSSYQPITISGGLFSVELGSSPMPPLPPSIWWNTIRYLGITIGAHPEMTPRTRLVSGFGSFIATYSTYSYHATVADQADTAQWSKHEPGIATAASNSEVSIYSTTMQDILTVTITTPDAGYIVIDAKGYAVVYAAAGVWNMGWVQIDESAAGIPYGPYAQLFGLQNAPNAQGVTSHFTSLEPTTERPGHTRFA